MDHIRFIWRTASVVLAIGTSLVSFALFPPSAFALMVGFPSYANGRLPSPKDAHLGLSQLRPTVVRVVVGGGMAGWVVALIAVGAALVAAAVTLLVERARSAHQRPSMSAA